MNLEYYNKLVSEPPVDVAHSYIFIVSRRDLAINIIAAGYNSLYIGNDGDSVDDLIEYALKRMRRAASDAGKCMKLIPNFVSGKNEANIKRAYSSNIWKTKDILPSVPQTVLYMKE